MPREPLTLQKGDYVIPSPDEGDEEFLCIWDRMWKPGKVLAIYANGNLRARADDGTVTYRGPISGFMLAP